MTAPAAGQRAYRLGSIDMLRGLVMVVMAIDHVRDYVLIGADQDPMQNPNLALGLFLTRWITHFCAPTFVLLAGVSAGLMTARKNPPELARFLLKRGVWLLVVEVFVISTALTFAPEGIAQIGGRILVGMQVIWVIGASMVILAAAQFLGRPACAALGAAIVVGHNLLDLIWPASTLFDQQWPWWVALHSQMSLSAGPFLLLFLYPLLPWIGVMLLGFGLSGLFERPAVERNALLLKSGVTITVAFLVLRALDIYGDPNGWQRQSAGAIATAIDFLNTTKYPPSLLFLLMTLGPGAILCGLADRFTGVVKNSLVMFGRVPFAFYVAHFYLVHALSVALGVVQGFRASQFLTMTFFYPRGYGISLPGVYLMWMLVIVILYPFCRWVAGLKARRRDWWLSYI